MKKIRFYFEYIFFKLLPNILRFLPRRAMLMDQDAGTSGAFVEYFGRLCSAPKGPALFVLKTGAALLYVSSARLPDGTLRAVFEEVEVDYDAGTTEENIHDIMQRSTTMLENSVREFPGQWFWMHRRWKTPPPAGKW